MSFKARIINLPYAAHKSIAVKYPDMRGSGLQKVTYHASAFQNLLSFPEISGRIAREPVNGQVKGV